MQKAPEYGPLVDVFELLSLAHSQPAPKKSQLPDFLHHCSTQDAKNVDKKCKCSQNRARQYLYILIQLDSWTYFLSKERSLQFPPTSSKVPAVLLHQTHLYLYSSSLPAPSRTQHHLQAQPQKNMMCPSKYMTTYSKALKGDCQIERHMHSLSVYFIPQQWTSTATFFHWMIYWRVPSL